MTKVRFSGVDTVRLHAFILKANSLSYFSCWLQSKRKIVFLGRVVFFGDGQSIELSWSQRWRGSWSMTTILGCFDLLDCRWFKSILSLLSCLDILERGYWLPIRLAFSYTLFRCGPKRVNPTLGSWARCCCPSSSPNDILLKSQYVTLAYYKILHFQLPEEVEYFASQPAHYNYIFQSSLSRGIIELCMIRVGRWSQNETSKQRRWTFSIVLPYLILFKCDFLYLRYLYYYCPILWTWAQNRRLHHYTISIQRCCFGFIPGHLIICNKLASATVPPCNSRGIFFKVYCYCVCSQEFVSVHLLFEVNLDKYSCCWIPTHRTQMQTQVSRHHNFSQLNTTTCYMNT